MVSQGILIGVAVGLFFAGLGIGYAALQSTTPTTMMNPQQMQEMHDMMMSNPEHMNQMMSNPEHMNQMMGPMMDTMMNNPEMRQEMMSLMMNHQGMMDYMMTNQDMMNMMGNNMMGNNMMGDHMMGSGMMDQGVMTSQSLQTIPTDEEPQTRTFQISMEEVEFYAEVENEGGQEAIAYVELHVWEPNTIIVNQGDTVVLEITNPRKHAHTLTIPAFNVNSEMLEPRVGTDTVTFVADTPGVFTFYCGLPYDPEKLYCDPDHKMMTGTLIVLE
ncbi:MAG TPA: cupredoxin domain-containing protein [Nitrosopumilus sp.]